MKKKRKKKKEKKMKAKKAKNVVPSRRVSGNFFPSVSGKKRAKIPAKMEVTPKITIAVFWL